MCGIVGIVGAEDVADRLLDGLKRLEYRGYDSAGIATDHDGAIERRRASGKLVNLAKELAAHPLPGTSSTLGEVVIMPMGAKSLSGSWLSLA